LLWNGWVKNSKIFPLTVGNWDVMICFESMGFNKKIIETKYLKVLKIHIKKLCNIKQRSKQVHKI